MRALWRLKGHDDNTHLPALDNNEIAAQFAQLSACFRDGLGLLEALQNVQQFGAIFLKIEATDDSQCCIFWPSSRCRKGQNFCGDGCDIGGPTNSGVSVRMCHKSGGKNFFNQAAYRIVFTTLVFICTTVISEANSSGRILKLRIRSASNSSAGQWILKRYSNWCGQNKWSH